MHSDIIVLAAGKGSRMQSGQAKVLHKLAGRTLIQHVYAQAMALNPRSTTVVVGHQSEQVIKHLGEQADMYTKKHSWVRATLCNLLSLISQMMASS